MAGLGFLVCGCLLLGTGLPSAVFDCGGEVFDLEAVCRERFPMPTDGLSGVKERLTDADDDAPAVATLDWKAARRKWPTGRHVAYRYRLRLDRPGPDPKKTALNVRLYRVEADGTQVVTQPEEEYALPLEDTGGRWRDVFWEDFGVSMKTEFLEFRFNLGGGLGKVEFKDLAIVPPLKRLAIGEGQKVQLRLLPLESFGGTFAIGRGQPQLAVFNWRKVTRTDLAPDKWELKLDLPRGIRALAAAEAEPGSFAVTVHDDGSSTASWRPVRACLPERSFGWWHKLGVLLASDLPVGAPSARGCLTAFHEGSPAAPSAEIGFLTVEPVRCAAKPRRYFNGCCYAGPTVDFADASATEAYAKTLAASGLDCFDADPEPLCRALRRQGVGRFLRVSFDIMDAYRVNATPFDWQARPEDERFVPYDSAYLPSLMRQSTCPVAVYGGGRYFREKFLPSLAETGRDVNGILANWEPQAYLGKGCACAKCRAAFAAFVGRREDDVAKDWPKCVMPGGRFHDRAAKFRALEHAKLVRTVQGAVVGATGGEKSDGLIPEIVWTMMTDETERDPRMAEMDFWEYAGDIRWINPWGPYVWWDIRKPYFREKRFPLVAYEAAKVIRERRDARLPPGKRPKLLSFPNGYQGHQWVSTPEWIALSLDSFLFAGWDGSSVYFFPHGYDVRWWRAFADATARAARCEDYVLDGVRSDASCEIRTVREYAAPCREVTAYLPAVTNVSLLQTASFDLKGGRLVAAMNFWSEGAAFFRLKAKGLKPGRYTLVSEGRTLWSKRRDCPDWSSEELEKGILLGVGALRTAAFEIRPSSEGAVCTAKDEMTQAEALKAYRALQSELGEKAERDHGEESVRGRLRPFPTAAI